MKKLVLIWNFKLLVKIEKLMVMYLNIKRYIAGSALLLLCSCRVFTDPFTYSYERGVSTMQHRQSGYHIAVSKAVPDMILLYPDDKRNGDLAVKLDSRGIKSIFLLTYANSAKKPNNYTFSGLYRTLKSKKFNKLENIEDILIYSKKFPENR